MQATGVKRIRIAIRSSVADTRTFELTVPWGAVTIDAVVPLLQVICDNVIAIQVSKTRVSCAAGCAHCCYQLIPISPAEAIFLNKLLRTMPRDRGHKLARDFRSIQDKSQALAAATNQEIAEFDRLYFQMRIPCPFLENNRCGIYEQRPLACREYHVDSPSERCIDPYRTNPHRAASGLRIAAMLNAFCGHLLHVQEKVVPLFAVGNWDEDHPAAKIVFDAEWLYTKLMSGIVKAGSTGESLQNIEWQFVDNAPDPPLQQTAAPPPKDTAKLMVQDADAENIRKIVQHLLQCDDRLGTGYPVIEIGSGDGHLRYLGNLCGASEVARFFDTVIETESDPTLVQKNQTQGKRALALPAQDLASHFGPQSTPLVMSLNVLDIFSATLLDEVLAAISAVLMPGGRVIHIMSSAIHPAVFRDIAAMNPSKIPLPHFASGSIGVVLVERTMTLPTPFSELARRPETLPTLFKQSPEDYVSMAAQVQSWLTDGCVPHQQLLLHEYSMSKLAAALKKNNFLIEHREIIGSTVLVARDRFPATPFNATALTNAFGVLTLDVDDTITGNHRKHSSRFGVLIGRKS